MRIYWSPRSVPQLMTLEPAEQKRLWFWLLLGRRWSFREWCVHSIVILTVTIPIILKLNQAVTGCIFALAAFALLQVVIGSGRPSLRREIESRQQSAGRPMA
jgi:hypothetical protein